jgi:uncharacterized protein YuzE
MCSDVPIEESDEDQPGIILDDDLDGQVICVEILNASQRIANIARITIDRITATSGNLLG